MFLLEEDRRLRQGAWLLLASLGAFFLSSMLLFVVYVARRTGQEGGDALGYSIPRSFLASTILLMGISLSLHYAIMAARRDQLASVFRLALLAMGLAIGFLLIQSEGMYVLMTRAFEDTSFRSSLYPFTFFLALIHALHVVGGVIALAFVVVGAAKQRYDHERHWGLQFCTIYWHFLDVVWLVMLLGFVTAIAMIHFGSR
jgi:cytochrome c oxidase subunit III